MTEDKVFMDTLLSFLDCRTSVGRDELEIPLFEKYSRRPAVQSSAIHIAALYGLRHAMQRLLVEGTSADTRDSLGRTPLFLAATMGEVDVVKLLLARDDVDVNAQTAIPYSITPLFVAAGGIRLEVLRTLLQFGADVNLRSWFGTALNQAVSSENATSTELLLEAGADPDSRDENDNPAIFEAAKAGENYWWLSRRPTARIVKLLHKYGANLEARDNSQNTLLHVAAKACNVEAVEMLLAEGLDPDAVDSMGQKPQHKVLDPPYYAPQSVVGAVVRLLSESRSRHDSNEQSGQAPLFNESWEQSQCPVDQGSDPREFELEDSGMQA